MAIINVGSINIDHSYRVAHLVQPGETLAAQAYHCGLGGKGVNQSIALQRAGADVVHVGAIGRDDAFCRAALAAALVDRAFIAQSDQATGHAMIQVDDNAENCILIYPGANACVPPDLLSRALAEHPDAAWVLAQNETNLVAQALHQAKAAGRKFVLSPAPYSEALKALPLSDAALLVLNEVEVCQLSGCDDLDLAVERLRRFGCAIVLTLGADGARYIDAREDFLVPAKPVQAIDTTAAGDTFLGYLLAAMDRGYHPRDAMLRATQAAALAVTRRGAADSIPFANEVFS